MIITGIVAINGGNKYVPIYTHNLAINELIKKV